MLLIAQVAEKDGSLLSEYKILFHCKAARVCRILLSSWQVVVRNHHYMLCFGHLKAAGTEGKDGSQGFRSTPTQLPVAFAPILSMKSAFWSAVNAKYSWNQDQDATAFENICNTGPVTALWEWPHLESLEVIFRHRENRVPRSQSSKLW